MPVMDNLYTHPPASLYEAFEPAEAKRLADKLEPHHSAKHGSWPNMAEIKLSVLARQCLGRRLPDSECGLRGERRRVAGERRPFRPARSSGW